jgi:hypothetical protein
VLAAGSKVAIAAGAADAPQVSYTFAVGDRRNPLAPDRLTSVAAAVRDSLTPASIS